MVNAKVVYCKLLWLRMQNYTDQKTYNFGLFIGLIVWCSVKPWVFAHVRSVCQALMIYCGM